MMIKFSGILLLILLSFQAVSQHTEWDNHVLINNIYSATETDQDVWAISNYSLLQINKTTETVTVHSNADIGFGTHSPHSIWKDSDDRLYYATRYTVGYYENGHWFKVEGFPVSESSYIKKILGRDEEGRLYFSSYPNGLTSWKEGDSSMVEHTLFNESIHGIMMDKQGGFWVRGYDWLAYTKDGEFEYFIEPGSHGIYLQNIIPGKAENEAWMISTHLLFFYDGDELHQIDMEELTGHSSLGTVCPIGPKQAVINVSGEVFLLKLENETWQVESLQTQFPVQSEYWQGAYADNDDVLWHFTDNDGELWRWSNGQNAARVENTNWLNIQSPEILSVDEEGRIWAAGSTGLNYLHGGSWQTFGERSFEQFNGRVNDITFDNRQNPVLATGRTLFYGLPVGNVLMWDDNSTDWDIVNMSGLVFENDAMRAVEIDQNGDLWTIGAVGPAAFAVNSRNRWFSFSPIDIPLSNASRFTCFEEDLDGSMWIGTDRGVLNYNGLGFQVFDFIDLGLATTAIEDLFVDSRGRLWIALGYQGARIFDGENWGSILADDMPFDFGFYKIIEGYDGDIWALSYGSGVARFDGENWQLFTPENSGLLTTYNTDIERDKQGRIWISSSRGLSVFDETRARILPVQLSGDQLIGIAPNPGCCSFQVNWLQQKAGKTVVELYNLQGQKLRTILEGDMLVGQQDVIFDQRSLPAGTYVITVTQLSSTSAELLVVK